MLQQCTAVPWSKAHLEPLRCLTIEATFGEKLPSCHGVRAAELLGEEVSGQPKRLRQSAASARLHPWARLVGVAQLDADSIGQSLDRFDEAEIVDLAHKVDYVAALRTGAEAIPIAAGRGDLKARSLFVVEGTQALHRSAGAAQSDVGADHFLDASPIAYGGDVFLVDPAPHAEEFMFRS